MQHRDKSRITTAKSTSAGLGSTGHKRPYTPKKGKTRIPAPQTARIMQRYIAGENIRSIARDEGRDRGTIRRIVGSQEMKAHVQSMREQYYGLAAAAMESVYRALQESTDGRLGHEILRNLGVIPSAQEIAALQQQVQEETGPLTEEQEVKGVMLQLVEEAYRRAEIYGHPKPSLDDLLPPKHPGQENASN